MRTVLNHAAAVTRPSATPGEARLNDGHPTGTRRGALDADDAPSARAPATVTPDRAFPLRRRVREPGPVRHYRIGAVPLSLRADVPGVRSDFHRLYARYERPAGGPAEFQVRVSTRRSWRSLRRYFHVAVDEREWFCVRAPRAILPHVEWAVNGAVMAGLPRYYQVHAGVVSRDGGGLILPAPPQSGKSTLTAALVQRGWRYLSDEFALIDPESLRLQPYPKAICIKEGSFDVIRRARLPFAIDRDFSKGAKGRVRFIDPHAVHRDAISPPVPVRAVMFPRYGGPATPRIEPMSRARAVFELAQVSFSLARLRAGAIDLLADLVSHARCYRLVTGDLNETCALIDRAWHDGPARKHP